MSKRFNNFKLSASHDALCPTDPTATAMGVGIHPRVYAYGQTLLASRSPLPAKECRPNQPYMTHISEVSDIHQTILSQPANRNYLKAIGALVGFEIVHDTRTNENLLICELRFLRPDSPSAAAAGLADRNTRRRAIFELIEILEAGSLEGLMGDASEALEGFLALPPAAADETMIALAACLKSYIAGFPADHLPDDARQRIAILLDRHGMSVAELKRQTGFDRIGLKEIIAGARRFTPNDVPMLQAFEKYLGVTEGSLQRDHQYGRRGVGHASYAFPPEAPILTDAQKNKLARYLPPHFATLAQAAKQQAILQGLALIADMVTPERAAKAFLQSQDNAYALRGEVLESLQGEFQELTNFYKTPFVGFDKTHQRDPWSNDTCLMRENMIRSILGYLASNERGDQKLDLDDLSIGLLLSPNAIYQYLYFRSDRRQKAFAEFNFAKKVEFTEEYIGILYFAKLLLDPQDGWITNSPELADKLKPIKATLQERRGAKLEGPCLEPGWLLGPKLVAAAQADWRATCAAALEVIMKLIRDHRKKVKTSRDSHEAIKAILKHKDPFSAFRMAISGLDAELRLVAHGTMAYAEILRDKLAISLEAQAGFRRRTLLRLDWTANNRGQLRQVDGKWHLEVPTSHFKNPKGAFFVSGNDSEGHAIYREFFDLDLEDWFGLYADLEAYLTIYRPMLLRGRKSDALLVGSRNSHDARLTGGALDQLCRKIFMRHLIFNPLDKTGFEGVFMTAGWHAWRHILATTILKETGDYKLAADSIQDSEDLVRSTYGVYLPSDRSDALKQARQACYKRRGPYDEAPRLTA